VPDAALANQIGILGRILGREYGPLTFTTLEVGALPVDEEPSHALLDAFPGSSIIGFEVDEALCTSLNGKARPGIRYFPVALGAANEKRSFYETMHPMCSSLYRPNEELIRHFNNMQMAMLKSVTTIDTISLDSFAEQQGIERVDFIKIDIQGAELDVFRGGVRTLSQTVGIVTEAEFIPHYLEQPLFGDVCGFLTQQAFLFHKFISFGGRALKPVVIGDDVNTAVQLLWTDAMFIKDILRPIDLTDEQLLRLAVVALLYRSVDVTHFCLSRVDQKNQTNLCKAVFGSEP
jgi:FkbM family methyltransferase